MILLDWSGVPNHATGTGTGDLPLEGPYDGSYVYLKTKVPT